MLQDANNITKALRRRPETKTWDRSGLVADNPKVSKAHAWNLLFFNVLTSTSIEGIKFTKAFQNQIILRHSSIILNCDNIKLS